MQRTIFVDDFTGKEGDTVATRRFSVDGVDYEIDAADDTWAAFLKRIQSTVDKARPAATPDTSPVRRRGKQRSGRQADAETKAYNAKVREWAGTAGIVVSPRGRIPADVMERAAAAGVTR